MYKNISNIKFGVYQLLLKLTCFELHNCLRSSNDLDIFYDSFVLCSTKILAMDSLDVVMYKLHNECVL